MPRHGELPIFSTKAHIFQIDPDTKKKWLPLSTQAIPVSFYHDSARHLYRIISVDGVKVLINSTLASNMTFTKTSQKFGQWSDVKAGTVYGLGFSSEEELIKFMEKFDEVKQFSSSSTDTISTMKKPADSTSSPANHLPQTEAPQEKTKVDIEQQLEQVRYENDRLKIALAQSSANAKKWETELQTLRNNNIRLNAALQESATNVEEWKKQLQTYKEENTRLQLQVSSAGPPEALETLQRQLSERGDKFKLLELELTSKQQALEEQRALVEQLKPLKVQNQRLEAKIQALEEENARMQLQLSHALNSQQKEDRLKNIQQQLSVKINELYVMNDSLAEVLQSSN